MATDSIVSQVQRRIELQSPEDLTYLIANVRAAAAERLNESIPLVAGQEGQDELRDEVERMVNEYIENTFTLAAPNLTINGMPVPESSISSTSTTTEPSYEPFDTRKRRRLADLTTQEEKLLEEVASLKRNVPTLAATRRDNALKDAIARDDDDLRRRVEEVKAQAEETSGEGMLDGLERQDGVEENWRGAVEGLGRLKREMPAVVARMERARVAGEYVVTGGR
ncbi:hypothetical protein CC79DRAFT_1366405 [Sarocladium strictum]